MPGSSRVRLRSPSAGRAGGVRIWPRPAAKIRRRWRALSRTFTPPWRGCCSVETNDVVVVGAGPTGLACGIELKRRGVSVVLIDKGCVVNSIYEYPTNLV